MSCFTLSIPEFLFSFLRVAIPPRETVRERKSIWQLPVAQRIKSTKKFSIPHVSCNQKVYGPSVCRDKNARY